MATLGDHLTDSNGRPASELADQLVTVKHKRRRGRRRCSENQAAATETRPKPKITPKTTTTTTVILNKRKLLLYSILANVLGSQILSTTYKITEAKKPEPTNSIFDTILGKSAASQEIGAQNQTLPTSESANLLQQQQVVYNPSSGGQSLDAATRSYLNGQASDKVTLPGDILLGGLFPIHMKGAKAECGEINKDRGIQRLEAMLYALDRINQDSTLLPDIKLGAILLDSCSSSTYALNQSLEFIRASINTVESSAFECKDKSTPRPKYGSKMIAGVIGGSYSEVSLQVANLLRLFRIPQVSYASTGTALSDKTLYDLFARTVPSDMFQARAIADIVLKLKWSYVSLVSSEGLYGDSGSKEFMKQASARRICIATHEKISPAIGHSAYDAIVASLHKRNATGVVLFTRVEDSRALLLAVKRAGLFKNFAWIAADGWGTHQKLVEGVEDVARGAITVELQAKAIPGFDEYMKALTPWQNGRNPWFSEYWQEWFDCQLEAQLLQQQRLAAGLSAYYPTSRRRDTDSGSAGPYDGSYDTSELEGDVDSVRVRRHDAGEATGGSAAAAATQSKTEMPQCKRPTDTPSGAKAKDASEDRKSGDQEQRCINSAEIEEFKRRSSQQAKATSEKQNARPRRSPAQDTSSTSVDQTGNSQVARMKQFCSPNLRINESNGYRQEQKVQFVVDAVYAMAHALHKAWYNLCDAQPGVVCEALKELNGGEFYSKYLLNVSFKDLAGSEVKFDERGDGLGRYNIYNFRQVKPQQQQQQHLQVVAAQSEMSSSATRAQSDDESSGQFSNTSSISRRRRRRQQQDPNAPPDATYDETDDQSGASSDQEAGDGGDVSGTSTLATTNQADQTSGTSLATIGSGQPTNEQLMSSIEHIYTSNRDFEYSLIGRWTEDDYHLELNDIQSIMGDKVIPESYCSKPCELGQAKIMRAGDQCCWICKTCLPFEFLPDEFSCRDCGIGRWPIANKTSCFELPQKFLRWDSVYSLISLTIACLGIGLTLFVIVIFLRYLDTPVVKASGRELSFILLAGIAFCHLSTFVLLSKPTTFICGSQRFLVNFGFALMYASLLVKTNRISRIFNCARKTAKRPSFISPRSQMLITGILVTVQIFLTIVWFVLEPPGIRADSPEGKRDEVILKCRTKGKSFIISLIYNMILITTCTVYAVKTRKIPENFNESKFIGFTMYTTIVIWLAFVTMFFGTNNSYEIQINTMCVCISLSAYVTLFCLFSPKISIILLHPDKNVRKLTMNSATYKRPFKPVSSMASVDGGRERSQAGGVTGGAGGPHDAGSAGGPMSTTSNVLNLADGNRLQESSIVSNVVNSNSGASNCSQTGAGGNVISASVQQQVAAIVCSNCGAHQVARFVAGDLLTTTGSSGVTGSLNTTVNGSGSGATSSGANQRGVVAGYNRTAGKSGSGSILRNGNTSNKQQFVVSTGSRPVTSGLGISAAATASIAANCAIHGTDSGAKILHTSRVISERSTTTTNLVKRLASDDHLVGIGAINDDKCHLHGANKLYTATTGTAMLVGVTGSASGGSMMAKASSGGADQRKYVASMSRLNDMNNSTTSSERAQGDMDESYSSLANDSYAGCLTSQDNTPCNRRASGGGRLSQAHNHPYNQMTGSSGKVASDSMLCNESIHSVDYCSECCPSYECQCSCMVCSSSGNGNGGVGGTGNHESANDLGCSGNGNNTNSNGSGGGSNGDNSTSGGGQLTATYCVHGNSMGACQVAATPHLQQQQHDNIPDDYDAIMCNSLVVTQHQSDDNGSGDTTKFVSRLVDSQTGDNVTVIASTSSTGAKFRRQKSEDATVAARVHSSSRPEVSRSLKLAGSSGANSMEMRTISSSSGGQRASGASSREAQVGLATRESPAGQRLSDSTQSSVMYALQAAAQSALGAATGSPLPSSSKSSAISSRDKSSEPLISDRKSSSASIQQQQQPIGGTIRASIEMVKSRQKQSGGSSSSSQYQHVGSSSGTTGCSKYHDDYEYSYGLVRSDSENGQYFYDQDEPDDGDYDDEDHEFSGETNHANRSRRHKSTIRHSSATSKSSLTRNEIGAGEPYGDDDHDEDDDDDDFGHDGRILSPTTSGSSHKGAGKSSSSKVKGKKKEEHRINSVALIAATLSAGGAIMDSGASTPTPKVVSTGGSGDQTAPAQLRDSVKEKKDDGDNGGSGNRKDRMTFVTTI